MKRIEIVKYLIVQIIVLIIADSSYSQNLVVNSSFEDTSACPSVHGDIDKASGWSSYSNTPDYFNSCALSCGYPGNCFGVPKNFVGFQMPYDGNAYVGIITYNNNAPTNREFIGTQLVYNLDIGKKYFVSAYFCRGNDLTTFGASNNLGFRFSTVPFSDVNPCPVDNFSHINSSSVLSDSVNWTKISGSFIADSLYKYLIIGNFYDDQHTDTIDLYINSLYSHSYYYVDNVCVTLDSLNCNPINGILNFQNIKKFNVFPNPFTDKLIIETEFNKPLEVLIYDLYSRKVHQQKFTSYTFINTENFSKGVYLFETKVDGVRILKKIVKQ